MLSHSHLAPHTLARLMCLQICSVSKRFGSRQYYASSTATNAVFLFLFTAVHEVINCHCQPHSSRSSWKTTNHMVLGPFPEDVDARKKKTIVKRQNARQKSLLDMREINHKTTECRETTHTSDTSSNTSTRQTQQHTTAKPSEAP